MWWNELLEQFWETQNLGHSMFGHHTSWVNDIWHIYLIWQLLDLLCDNSKYKGIITIFIANIHSLWTWLLHLHALEHQLCTNVLYSGFFPNLLEIVNHNNVTVRRFYSELRTFAMIPIVILWAGTIKCKMSISAYATILTPIEKERKKWYSKFPYSRSFWQSLGLW